MGSQGQLNIQKTLLIATLVCHYSQEYVATGAKVIVAAGVNVNGVTMSNVEVIDLSKSPKSCQNLQPLPFIADAAQGALGLNNLPTICGGFSNSGVRSSACASFENGTWKPSYSLNTARSSYAMTSFNLNNGPTQLFVAGGAADGGPLNSTEYLTAGGWVNFTQLPLKISYHCIVNVYNSTLAVIAGFTSPTSAGETYVISDGNPQWTLGPRLKYPRGSHKCALVKKNSQSNEKSVIVVGGSLCSGSGITSSVEIFNIANMTWERGYEFPTPISSGSLVTDDDGAVYYIGGSVTGNAPSASGLIYKLAHAEAQWELLPQVLQTPRMDHVSMVVQDQIATCN